MEGSGWWKVGGGRGEKGKEGEIEKGMKIWEWVVGGEGIVGERGGGKGREKSERDKGGEIKKGKRR